MLDALLADAGRQPEDVRRSFNAPIVCGRTPAEMEDRLRGFRRVRRMAPICLWIACWRRYGDGSPRLSAHRTRSSTKFAPTNRSGIAEITLQWFDTEDIEGLEVLAHEVLPRRHAQGKLPQRPAPNAG